MHEQHVIEEDLGHGSAGWLAKRALSAYQDVGVLAHSPIGLGLDNALDCPSRVQLLGGSHERKKLCCV